MYILISVLFDLNWLMFELSEYLFPSYKISFIWRSIDRILLTLYSVVLIVTEYIIIINCHKDVFALISFYVLDFKALPAFAKRHDIPLEQRDVWAWLL